MDEEKPVPVSGGWMNKLICEGRFSVLKIPASNVIFRAPLFTSTLEQLTPGRILSLYLRF